MKKSFKIIVIWFLALIILSVANWFIINCLSDENAYRLIMIIQAIMVGIIANTEMYKCDSNEIENEKIIGLKEKKSYDCCSDDKEMPQSESQLKSTSKVKPKLAQRKNSKLDIFYANEYLKHIEKE